ncbi:MAG: hypothetical protein AB1349_01425 [Elusimicrobiota bacterium]
MKLSEIEKKEMLEDSKSKKRMLDFRKIQHIQKKMAFEEYIEWLMEIQKIHPVKPNKNSVIYKNIKI